MNEPKTMRLDVELTDAEAWELAQFCKRSGFSDFRNKARNDVEASEIRDAMGRIQEALAKAGYEPR